MLQQKTLQTYTMNLYVQQNQSQLVRKNTSQYFYTLERRSLASAEGHGKWLQLALKRYLSSAQCLQWSFVLSLQQLTVLPILMQPLTKSRAQRCAHSAAFLSQS